MSKTLDALSVADVLRLYRELDLPSTSVGMEPLPAYTLDTLRRVHGYTNPQALAGQLTSAILTLWTARKSGELADEDADATTWLLSEVSSLLEHAIEAHDEAVWWLAEHERVKGRRHE